MMELVADVVKDMVCESTHCLLQAAMARVGQGSDFHDLLRQLESLGHILSTAERSCNNNGVLRCWLKQAAEVAHCAEDVMDELLERKFGPKRVKTDAGYFFSLSSMSNPLVLAHAVRSIGGSVDRIYQEAHKLGIRPAELGAGCSDEEDRNSTVDGVVAVQRELPNLEVLVGRDEDKERIVRLVDEASRSSKHLSVVGIHGPAGLGKTALCKTVFNAMEDKFKERIWICVSPEFEFTRLLNDMIEQIGDKKPSNSTNKEVIIQKLQKKMNKHKFLLVLDDVWATFGGYWDSLKACLQNVGTSTGNTVLVTSRIRHTLTSLITLNTDHDPLHNEPDFPSTYQLESLSEEDSWSLFVLFLGKNNLSNATEKQVSIARKMWRKCDGVPLAIKVLGSLLCLNSVSEWETMEEDPDIWNTTAENGHFPLILPSVKLSFKYLPSVELKRCFACCAIFKEDEVIEKDRLIQLWLAEGLLHERKYGSNELPCHAELLGEKYFHVLLNYSLFQDAEFDVLGKVRSCKLHDVVHSLAQTISNGYNEIVESRSLRLQTFPEPVAWFEKIWREDPITKIRRLRVLILAGRLFLDNLPDSIGKLKHLRYLELSVRGMERLPIGLGKLYYLQTLRINGGRYSSGGAPRFPDEFTRLGNLRHLHTNLGMGIPVGLGMLTRLQTLPPLDLLMDEYWGGNVSELENLQNLRGKLELQGLRHPKLIKQLKKAQLGTKRNIQSLVLKFSSSDGLENDFYNHMMIMAGIEPHPNLVSLEIHYYDSKTWPSWMMQMTGYGGSPLNNLVFLRLYNCSVFKQLPCLRNLSSLKELKIEKCYQATSLDNVVECLVSLRRLELSACPGMEKLPDRIGSLSRLKVLKIICCRKVHCLPTGLSDLPKLETLVVSRLSRDVTMFPFPSNLAPCSPLSASLRELHMHADSMDKVVNLPDKIQHLRQLRCLQIECFRSLKELPEWIGSLTSMETLRLWNLPLVRRLPSQAAMERLSQLKTLRVWNCALLKEACEDPDGQEQIKIQKIRCVDIRERL